MENDKKIAKTIIILGNGFDLFLGLPTRFKNFIDFCENNELFFEHAFDKKTGSTDFDFSKYYDENNVIKISKDLLINFPYIFSAEDKEKFNDFKQAIADSKLISYCIKLKKENSYNWCDFERHLLNICKECEEYCNICSKVGFDYIKNYNYVNPDLKLLLNEFSINTKCFNFDQVNPYKVKNTFDFLPSSVYTSKCNFIKELSSELNLFTIAFNMYIKFFVCNIPLQKHIDRPCNESPTYLINFNYTWNEECFKNARYCHIHGLSPDNNIIIGINDDELPDEYIFLQKKFLSIKMKTDLSFNPERMKKYYSLDEFIGECILDNVDYQVFVIGHSLDSIDNHILKKIFNNKLINSTYLYYRSEDSKIKLLSKLYNLLGYDNVNSMVDSFPQIICVPFESLLKNNY